MINIEKNIKELNVSVYQTPKNLAFQIKENLIDAQLINIVAGSVSASTATKVTEKLARLGYITYVDIRSDTSIIKNKRKIRLILTLKKTLNFERLYNENNQKRERLIEESKKYNNY